MQGYLLNVTAMRRYSLWLYVKKWGIWHISGEHRLDCLLGLMLGTGFATINIIGDVNI